MKNLVVVYLVTAVVPVWAVWAGEEEEGEGEGEVTSWVTLPKS